MDNGKNELKAKKIKVYGIVQGVGFRPLVYRIAKKLNINGTVRNVGGYVEIIAQTSIEALDNFLTEIRLNQQNGCEIIKLETEDIPCEERKEFRISFSKSSEKLSIIPPDLPVCPECQAELKEEEDRRFHNPFISCMSCGPRYTIIEELPYDRQNTTMDDFGMCTECGEEYTSPDSRRFHAQTISCNDCGPYLIFKSMSDSSENIKNSEIQNLQDNTREKQAESKWDKSSLIKSRLVESRLAESKLIESKLIESKHTESRMTESELTEIKLTGCELSEDKQSECRLTNQAALKKAVSIIKEGGIVAVKGIGGYHFVCSPFNEDTVQNLRTLKGREQKPFAVMFSSLKEIEDCCLVSEEEKALLETKARPIVLLYMHNNTMAPSVNKGSIYCGAFLPYTPLQILLMEQCGPLIMTSANLSNQPVMKDDEMVLALNSPYLQGVLYNTRRIVRSVDDSVAKIIDGKPQLIRRSRGYVPYPVTINQEEIPSKSCIPCNEQINCTPRDLDQDNGLKDETILEQDNMIFAAGGDLKAAFCLYQAGNAVVSQYFGDLEEVTVMDEYRKSYADLTRLLKIKPTLAVCDLHPNYHSARFAKDLGIPVLQVQHHHAHIAAVMAEHDLRERVIGIAFDGTGYGTDGTIWGGEFLVCEGMEYVRAAHLSYTPIIGGDQSMKDAKKTAACYLLNSGLEDYVQDERKEIIKSALKHKLNTVLTSSMGRLFDAVAAILDIGQENRYEGECAAGLEMEAILAIRNNRLPIKLTFAISEKDEIIEMNPKPLLNALCKLRKEEAIGSLALGFHYAVAEAIAEICERLRNKYSCNQVVLSGGVFQNNILTERSLELLRENGFEVYVNMAVPPNDGAISLGQTYLGLCSLNKGH